MEKCNFNDNVQQTKNEFSEEIKYLNEKISSLREKHKKKTVSSLPKDNSYPSQNPPNEQQQPLLHKTNSTTNKEKIKTSNEKTTSLFHPNSLEEYKQIEEILNTLSKHKFSHQYSKDEILEALHTNSFNIKNTFIQLRDLDYHKSFSKKDDYIIKFMPETELCKELCLFKGKVNFERRKKYLQIESYCPYIYNNNILILNIH